MIRRISAIAAVFVLPNISIADQPSTWQEFTASKKSEDVALVKKLKKQDWWKTCVSYGKFVRQKAQSNEAIAHREFLLHDNMLNGKDLMNIYEKKISIGMSQCGVFASIGLPEKTNNTVSTSGSHTQLIYRTGRYRYIYTVDVPGTQTEIVSSYQN